MAVQTAITDALVPRIAGLAMSVPPGGTASRVMSDATGCNFGVALCEGTIPGPGGQARKLAASADIRKIVGIAQYQPFTTGNDGLADVQQNEDVALVRTGLVAMLCPVAITPDSVLYWVVTGANAGLLTTVVSAPDLASNIRCEVGAGIGGIGLFRVNFT